MEKLKDIEPLSCLAVLLVFTIGYFLMVNKISYAFENSVDLSKSHDNKIKVIEECSKKYASINDNLFNEDDTIYIKVSDLVKNPIQIKNKSGHNEISEKVLQKLILEDIPSFLKELGNGFSFIDSEYKIKTGDRYEENIVYDT